MRILSFDFFFGGWGGGGGGHCLLVPFSARFFLIWKSTSLVSASSSVVE